MEFISNPVFIIIAIIVLIALFFFATYNSFVTARNKTQEAASAMDVTLVKRYDLIPNLVATVKGYASHEKETLENVVAARSNAMNAKGMEEKLAAEGELSKSLGRLMAVTEAYPDLKANTNFMDLQQTLKNMEAEISSSRKYYNAVVTNFNTKTELFPGNIIASIFGFKRQPLFEVTDEEQRSNVKVEF